MLKRVEVVSKASAPGPSLPSPGARPSAEMTETKAEMTATGATVTAASWPELARAGLSVAASPLNKGQVSLPCPWPGSRSPRGLQNPHEEPHSPTLLPLLTPPSFAAGMGGPSARKPPDLPTPALPQVQHGPRSRVPAADHASRPGWVVPP